MIGPRRVLELHPAVRSPAAWGAAVTVAGTAALVAAFVWPSGPAVSAPALPPSGATVATGGHSGAAAQQLGSVPVPSSPPASPRPSQGGPASHSAAPVPLTARFARQGDGLTAYPAALTVTNPGQAGASGWTVVLTLPRNTLSVTDVSGATVTRDGAVWTFTPNVDTAQVGAGRSVTVSFRVSGATLLDAAPTACTVNGNPCQGVG